jgi:hypothetical protein
MGVQGLWRDHVPGSKRRQEGFTGDGKCTDQAESAHVAMLELVDKAYKTLTNMRREDDEQKRVHLRHTLKKTIDL